MLGVREVVHPFCLLPGYLFSEICQSEHANRQNCLKSYCFLFLLHHEMLWLGTGHAPWSGISALKSTLVKDSLQRFHELWLFPLMYLCNYIDIQEPIWKVLMHFWWYERYIQGTTQNYYLCGSLNFLLSLS